MEILLWKIPDDYPEVLIGKYQRKVSPDRFLFQQGREIVGNLPTPVVMFDAPAKDLTPFADLANSGMLPLVSQPVADVLVRMCASDVQMIPARVVAADAEVPGYSIVNATRTVRSIDHARSQYSLFPGTNAIMRLHTLVCVPECLGSYALARDQEFLSNLLVRADLGEQLKGFKGIGLYRPGDMHW